MSGTLCNEYNRWKALKPIRYFHCFKHFITWLFFPKHTLLISKYFFPWHVLCVWQMKVFFSHKLCYHLENLLFSENYKCIMLLWTEPNAYKWQYLKIGTVILFYSIACFVHKLNRQLCIALMKTFQCVYSWNWGLLWHDLHIAATSGLRFRTWVFWVCIIAVVTWNLVQNQPLEPIQFLG